MAVRKAQQIKLVDRLHHAVVYCCLGVGGLCGVYMGVRIYDYIVNIRPKLKAEQARLEQELLNEGRAVMDSAAEMQL